MNDTESPISRYHYNSDFILATLPKNDIEALQKNAQILHVKKGKAIFHENAHPKSVYIIIEGKVKLFQTNDDDVRQIVYIYKQGEPFGYRQILCDETYPVTAMALEDTELMVISSKTFTSLLEKSYFLTRNLLQSLSSEFSVWVNRITSFARKSVKERLALTLLILNEKFKIKGQEHIPVVIKISRTDLAEYVGVPLETLVRHLKFFKVQGWIHIKGKRIIILKYDMLVKTMGD